MEHARIAGEPATLEAAIAEAAELLASSRHPLIAGLGTDVAGARAAVTLAERVGAVVDHMHADALLRNLDVMRCSGVVLTTPNEADVRADTLLLVGPGHGGAWPELPRRLFGLVQSRQGGVDVERRIFCLCPGRDFANPPFGKTAAVAIGKQPGELPALIAALRARVAGRSLGGAQVSTRKLDEIAAGLKGARYGVVIWSAATLDALTIEMLCGLVDDLNATTRFAGLPLAPGDNAVGVMQACAWMTGVPVRSGLGREFPHHDPWLFDGRRLVASGETDCVVWISAYSAASPAWRKAPPTIALTGSVAKFPAVPRVHIAVGRPGVDHDGVEYVPSIGTLAFVEAKAPSEAISVADAIARIAAILPAVGERAC
jgi:formylmethanofuran dehydrogenase subunit B